ncbi:hypothetical protein N5J23_04850 [Comamonas aquatica]|uniref:Peptidase S24/S26A/S26B/S26C domain-containing protein n=1 Tax=Comamonas aquatica TaxID=225991 RepID=A0AA42W059_9BURK|nr:S24 family peptidase [Comamonas aquatica]MDH1429116.1 hypothetical protein [Comamonas aquatica]MDH1604993.1 hypothetical protein [Comamonas aquatica]MDH1616017.1 hypothetical protein [Comamonas aquatica]MDH2004882.1 hypothetical protein [Comamonas aquatica]
MTSIQDRLREVFATPLPRGLMAKIGGICGVSRPTVSAWFNNPEKVRTISRTHAELICSTFELKVSPLWLSEGIGPKEWNPGELVLNTPRANVETTVDLKKSRQVPVTGSVKGGDDGFLTQDTTPDGFVEYWTGDPHAYALRIKGDSMHPRYRHGEFVVVTPSIEPQPGRDVVVRLTNGKCLLKQLNWVRGGEIQLLSINNDYGPMTFNKDEVECIARVAGSVGPDSLIF